MALGNIASSLELLDLPIPASDMRATSLFKKMKQATNSVKLKIGNWKPAPGAGWELSHRLLSVNAWLFVAEICLAMVSGVLFYSPALFLRSLVRYLESDPERKNKGWGFFFCLGLFLSNVFLRLGRYFPSTFSSLLKTAQ